MPHVAVRLHGADILHRWQVVHAVARAEAVDVEPSQGLVGVALIPDAGLAPLDAQVQDAEVLRQLDVCWSQTSSFCLKMVLIMLNSFNS